MRIISQLAEVGVGVGVGVGKKSKKNKEDTFGMNDDDWNVYRAIVSGRSQCASCELLCTLVCASCELLCTLVCASCELLCTLVCASCELYCTLVCASCELYCTLVCASCELLCTLVCASCELYCTIQWILYPPRLWQCPPFIALRVLCTLCIQTSIESEPHVMCPLLER